MPQNGAGRRTLLLKHVLPAAVAGILFLIILAINGLWPFGRATIDYYDMAQWSDLFYYHNFDELHGQKSFLFDWYLNLGRVIPGLNEPSPFDLLFYFVPRDAMLPAMSMLMMVKIMACAFTMGLFIDSVNKDIPYVFRLMLSAGYGLCGFVIVNYTVPMWIDMAVFVPLILMFAQKALTTGRFVSLAVTVFIIMIDDYYFTLQTLMFVFFIGGAYMIYSRFAGKKADKKEELHVTALAAGIILGAGLSAFSWIPDIAFGTSSARFANGAASSGIAGAYAELLSHIQPAYLSRWFSLLGFAFPASLTVVGSFDELRSKRYADVIFRAVCVFMAVSQLFVESIHLMLHFGSYVDYPVRNGFMIYCIIAAIAAKGCAGNESSAGEDGRASKRSYPAALFIAAASAIASVIIFRIWYVNNTVTDHTVLLVTMGIMALLAFVHVCLITFGKGKLNACCTFLWTAELIIFGTIMIGKPAYVSIYGSDPEQEGEYIRITDQLTSSLDGILATGDDAALCRIKNPDTSLNANYGIVMRRETLSGWTNLASDEQIRAAVLMGYSNQFTRLLDSGGNVFSDTLLHITDVISHRKLDERIYEKVADADVVSDHLTGEKTTYHLYRNRFSLPFAMPVSYPDELAGGGEDTVSFVNAISRALGAKKDIASYEDKAKAEKTNDNGHEISTLNIGITGDKTLYFTGKCVDTDHYNTRIYVNGESIAVPSINENDNELFPAHFNNNTVELGSFSDEDVTVTVDMDCTDDDKRYDWNVYTIDTGELAKLCDIMPKDIEVSQGRRSLDISFDNTEKPYSGLLIPVSYNEGWSAVVNGSKTDIAKVNGLLMYVPVGDGIESIHMSYFPPFMGTGAFIAMLSVVAIIFLAVKYKNGTAYCRADRILAALYALGFAAVFVVIYVIPVIYAAAHMI